MALRAWTPIQRVSPGYCKYVFILLYYDIYLFLSLYIFVYSYNMYVW